MFKQMSVLITLIPKGSLRENPLTIHPPDLHLSIISSWHNQWHCGMEGSPVHSTIMALKREPENSLEAVLWLKSKGKTRLQPGLPRHSSQSLCVMLLTLSAYIGFAHSDKLCRYHSSSVEQSCRAALLPSFKQAIVVSTIISSAVSSNTRQ